MRVNELMVWMDCEMTGLDLAHDELVEVAALVTDGKLNVLGDGVDLIIKPSTAAIDQMGDFVRSMHQSSGLLDELDHGLAIDEAEQRVLDYIKEFVPEARKAPLAGNTIGTDRSFLLRHMPRVDAHLHYRSVDVSSIKELARRWFPRVYFAQPQKGLAHRALADIIESVRELAYYRLTLFVPAPGPNSDQAKEAAEKVVGSFAEILAAGDATPRIGVDDVPPPAASEG